MRTAVEGDGPVRLLGHAPSQPPAERARTAAILQRVAEGKNWPALSDGRKGEGTFGRFPMILVDGRCWCLCSFPVRVLMILIVSLWFSHVSDRPGGRAKRMSDQLSQLLLSCSSVRASRLSDFAGCLGLQSPCPPQCTPCVGTLASRTASSMFQIGCNQAPLCATALLTWRISLRRATHTSSCSRTHRIRPVQNGRGPESPDIIRSLARGVRPAGSGRLPIHPSRPSPRALT